jgi:CheY-like chemotaxis protein
MAQKPLFGEGGQGLDTAPASNLKVDDQIIDSVTNIDEDLSKNLDWVLDEYDKDTSEPLNLATELRRLAVLKSYRIVDSARDVAYERLISLVSRIYKAPMAIVSVIDLGRQYFISSRGFGDVHECLRKDSICAHNIISKLDLMIVPDLTKDNRFKDTGSVTGPPYIRFYAGAPLMCPEGYKLGTLCVMDTSPRPEGLSLDEKQNLREIADMVMDVMVEQREERIHDARDPAQLIACTAHDLLTPLMGIEMSLSLLQEDQDLRNTLSGQQQDVVDTAATCSSVMNRICQKTLEAFRDMSRTSTQSRKPARETGPSLLNLNSLVKNLHMVMEPFPKLVPLIITTEPSVPPVVVADDLKIFRSALNLLTNACAKTESGSVHLRIYVKEDKADARNQKQLVFECEDTGPGIDVSKYRSLFKPYIDDADPLEGSRDNISRNNTKSGTYRVPTHNTGLGLYSVASQISSMGGEYGFRPRGFSEKGSQLFDDTGNQKRGSIFWFRIPLFTPKEAPKESSSGGKKNFASLLKDSPLLNANLVETDPLIGIAQNEEPVNDKPKGVTHFEQLEPSDAEDAASTGQRKKRALIIEDSLVSRKTMARALTKLGFEVTQAMDGMEGLKDMQTTLFDLVLCDFLLPVMDGLDCVQQYRQFEVANRPWFDQFIIGMSAHASENDVEKGLNVGMDNFRRKPVTLHALKEILESHEFLFVSKRLDSISAEMDGEQVRPPKRAKLDIESETKSDGVLRVVLVAEEGTSISKLAEKAAESKGWKAVLVNDGEAALRLLQMRNWDAVLLDDELPGLTSSRCMKRFREWESKNRVNRQKNVIQMSSSFIPSHLETSSSVQLPNGFDGALGKPLCLNALQSFLDTVAGSLFCGSQDIVHR